MNLLVKKGILSEMECGVNIAYVLNDNSDFLSTEYKVMLSQKDSGFIRCMKMMFNGKTQLYYMTEGYKSLISMLGNIDADAFMTIAENLISDVLEVKNNGFLSCQNIDVSFERIYVDTNTYKVKLIYLPLNKKIFEGYSDFENELRTSLVKLISGLHTLSSPKMMHFSADLSNGLLSIEDLYKKIKSNPQSTGTIPTRGVPVSGMGARVDNSRPQRLKIVGIDSPVKFEVLVNKNEFIIGKKPNSVDAVIDYNKAISRVHCKIENQNGQYFIVDLESMNGTFVNKKRLLPNVKQQLKNGDIISLASSSFNVVIE